MSEFTEAVERGSEGLKYFSVGLCSSCIHCQSDTGLDEAALASALENGGVQDEEFFSWDPCELCGTGVGGNRDTVHAVDKNGDIVHLTICIDCVLYISNGDEPEYWN